MAHYDSSAHTEPFLFSFTVQAGYKLLPFLPPSLSPFLQPVSIIYNHNNAPTIRHIIGSTPIDSHKPDKFLSFLLITIQERKPECPEKINSNLIRPNNHLTYFLQHQV